MPAIYSLWIVGRNGGLLYSRVSRWQGALHMPAQLLLPPQHVLTLAALLPAALLLALAMAQAAVCRHLPAGLCAAATHRVQ